MNGQIIETKFLRSPIQDSNFGNAVSEAILLHSFPDHPDDYSFIFGTNELSNKEMATQAWTRAWRMPNSSLSSKRCEQSSLIRMIGSQRSSWLNNNLKKGVSIHLPERPFLAVIDIRLLEHTLKTRIQMPSPKEWSESLYIWFNSLLMFPEWLPITKITWNYSSFGKYHIIN